jgi:hypothetical protein
MKNKRMSLLLILAPCFFLLHNLEESLTMVNFLHKNLARLPQPIRLMEEKLQLTQAGFVVPVVLLTILVAWWSLWAAKPSAPGGVKWLWSVTMLILCANAVTHVIQGIWFREYTPGLVTAILLQLPITILVGRESVRAGWLTKRAAVGWFVAGFPLMGFFSLVFLFIGKGLVALF